MSGFLQIQTAGGINKLISVNYTFMRSVLLGDAAA